MARPSKYKPEFNDQVEKLCILGATDKEIADFFGVVESTVNYWKIHEPEFSESIKKGKILADANVSKRMYQRAMGYSCKETKVFVHNGKIITKEVIKHYPPDPVCCIFWLKNRRPEDWRDKKEIGINGKVNMIQQLAEMPYEKFQEMKDKLKNAIN